MESYRGYLEELGKLNAFSTRPSASPLLDQYDLNLGSTQKVPRPNRTNTPQAGALVRLLDINSEGRSGQVVTLTMGSLINDGEVAPGLAAISGPVTGIVEWGNGAASNRVEFDLPQPSRLLCDPFSPFTTNYSKDLVTTPRQSGLTLTLTASSIRVFARNDANLPYTMQPSVVVCSDSNDLLIDPTVFAFVGYGGGSGVLNALLRKSIYLTPTATLAGVTSFVCSIPPFAKRVWFPRVGDSVSGDFWTDVDAAPPIVVRFVANLSVSSAGAYTLGVYPVPTKDEGVLQVPPGASYLVVTLAASTAIPHDLLAIFELAI